MHHEKIKMFINIFKIKLPLLNICLFWKSILIYTYVRGKFLELHIIKLKIKN